LVNHASALGQISEELLQVVAYIKSLSDWFPKQDGQTAAAIDGEPMPRSSPSPKGADLGARRSAR
jgi:hypothetical protein